MSETSNWAAFSGDYLKAADVVSNEDEYVVVGVSAEKEDSKTTLILQVQREGITKKFGCNKTNLQAVQNACPNTPDEAIGKIVTFYKVDTQKPNGEPVKGLRIKF